MTTGMKRELRTSYDQAIDNVVAALKAEGFGVLTEVDMKQTLKNKLDVDCLPTRWSDGQLHGGCQDQRRHDRRNCDHQYGNRFE